MFQAVLNFICDQVIVERGMLDLMFCWLNDDQRDYVHFLFKIFFCEGLSNKIKGKVGFRWPLSIKVANGPIRSKPIRPSPNKLQALERPFSIKEHPFKTCLLIYLLRDRNKLVHLRLIGLLSICFVLDSIFVRFIICNIKSVL